MTSSDVFRLAVAAAVAALLTGAGCTRDPSTLEPASYPTDGDVFLDQFGSGVGYQAFGGSKLDALDIETQQPYGGFRALRVTVPSAGDPSGGFAGGAFVAEVPRDLTGYDALTFWARASMPATLNLVGIGNDNSGSSRFIAERTNLQVSTSWQKYVIPIPLAAKLEMEAGLFEFADGPDDGVGYDLWFDEIQFERLGTIAFPQPSIPTRTVGGEVGGVLEMAGGSVIFDVAAAEVTVSAAAGYFTFASSDDGVAVIAESGAIEIVGPGTATITAALGDEPAAGAVTVNAVEPPGVAAPVPTEPEAEVISLFSNAYTNRPVDTWSTDWDIADVADVQIAGDDVKRYTNLVYAGIDFASQPIDASAMTHLHMDVWTYDAAAFRIKLVDFGPDGAFGGDDDSEHEVALSTPPLTTGAWSTLDIPLADFAGLAGRAHLAQMILSGSSPTVYVDNVYFYVGELPPEPATPAPTPTVPAADAISLFSNAYTNVTVDTWSADWDQADVADVQIAGDDVKRYANLVFAGIEFTSQPVDASAMTHFHMDIWTPDPTATAAFRIKLVDFGADGAFGGGDDVEHELTFDAASTPPLASETWVSFDIPLADFTGLVTTGHLAQMIISGDPNTVFVDNIYFYRTTPSGPTVAAPTPTVAAADVISLYSNAYTNVTVGTWSADWDQADVADVQVAGNDTKLYTNLVFAGIEFTSPTVDASTMTHFHMDVWTPDPTATAAFRIKLVDFGADGVYGGGDEVEHELTFDAASTPPLVTGQWVSFDIPLADFTGLTTKGHLAQLIISGDPNTVYVDNVYFHR